MQRTDMVIGEEYAFASRPELIEPLADIPETLSRVKLVTLDVPVEVKGHPTGEVGYQIEFLTDETHHGWYRRGSRVTVAYSRQGLSQLYMPWLAYEKRMEELWAERDAITSHYGRQAELAARWDRLIVGLGFDERFFAVQSFEVAPETGLRDWFTRVSLRGDLVEEFLVALAEHPGRDLLLREEVGEPYESLHA